MAGLSLSDFTNSCDKNYFISYLTPSFIYILITYLLTIIFFPQLTESKLQYDGSFISLLANSYNLLQNLWINDFIILTFGTWIISVVLMTTNLQLTQFLEGYILLQKTPLLKNQLETYDKLECKYKNYKSVNKEYNRFRKGEVTKDQLTEFIKESGITVKDLETVEKEETYKKFTEQYIEIFRKFRTEFPPDRSYVLPTSFGNIIRSFELYSYYVYGIDAIAVWTRIIQFASEDLKRDISDTKAQVDLSVNIFYITIIVGIEYIVYSILTKSMPSIWLILLVFIFTWISYNMSLSLAKIWGESVKTVFDLYRGDLLEKMKISDVTKENEKEKWMELNRLFLYWKPL